MLPVFKRVWIIFVPSPFGEDHASRAVSSAALPPPVAEIPPLSLKSGTTRKFMEHFFG
jgi:hypothetical protein